MKLILASIVIMAFLLFISSCGDSLGINGAEYIKSRANSDTLRIDTMINFKKVVIETIITKTDTVINYIPIVREYDPVYSNRNEYQILENFQGNNEVIVNKKLDEVIKVHIVSILDYNPISPELSFQLTLENPLSNKLQQFENRSEVLSSLNLEFKGLSVLNDQPYLVRDLLIGNIIKFELFMINKDNKKRRTINESILGELVFYNRMVVNGQLRGLSMKGIIMIPAKGQLDIKKYSLDLSINLYFPEI